MIRFTSSMRPLVSSAAWLMSNVKVSGPMTHWIVCPSPEGLLKTADCWVRGMVFPAPPLAAPGIGFTLPSGPDAGRLVYCGRRAGGFGILSLGWRLGEGILSHDDNPCGGAAPGGRTAARSGAASATAAVAESGGA